MAFFTKITRLLGKKSTQRQQPKKSQPATPPISDLDAHSQAREVIFNAKDEAIRIKSQAEEEAGRLRSDLLDLERKLAVREESLDSRLKALGEKEEDLLVKEKELALLREEIDKTRADLLSRLEKAAKLTVEEAREKILAAVEEKAREEAGKISREIIDDSKLKAQAQAREILVSEMVHGATTYVAEFTVSSITVPNEEVKGRIIGKEGRNIRAFEQATGVDVELDEEGVIRLSSFDSVRREIARVALERLIKDARIQPARIEEVVAQVRAELERIMFEEGERLAHAVGVFSLPKDLILLLGKFKYRSSYGQNMIAHTLEETKLGIALASEVGADVNIVRLGCLLHDIGKVIDIEEGSHVTLGAQLLRKMGIPEKVVACVEEHHEDKPFSSVESMLVYISDAISGSRPGARFEDLEKYVARMKQLEEICKSFAGVVNAWVFQAGREIRAAVDPEVISDDAAQALALKIKEKIEAEIKDFPGQIRITVIRELRVSETAS